MRHCVQCDEASFKVRCFGCKAENLRKPHRAFSHEECNRFRQISKEVHQSHRFFRGKEQCPDREVLSVKDEFIVSSSHLFHSSPLADAANLRNEPCSFFGLGLLFGVVCFGSGFAAWFVSVSFTSLR